MTEITIKMKADGLGNYTVVVGDEPPVNFDRKSVVAMVATVPAAALKIVLQSLVDKAEANPREWVSISSVG